MELNGEVIVLDEGKVLQVGPAKEIFENPKTLKVAEISNDPPMNILKANIESNKIRFEGIEIDIPNHLSSLKDKNFVRLNSFNEKNNFKFYFSLFVYSRLLGKQ